MTDRADVWMPLYPGDYYRDTRRLTTEQHGAYFLLMLDYWTTGPPPDDNVVLSAIAGLSLDAWSIHRASLQGFFKIVGGRWTHKRIDAEKEKAIANAYRRSERAKTAADARWNAVSIPVALPRECPLPSPSPSPAKSPSPSLREESSSVQAVADAWNKMAKGSGLSAIKGKTLSRERKNQIRARIAEHGADEIIAAIKVIPDSPFLMGKNERGWKADFNFVLRPARCTSLIEGSYHNRGKGKGSAWTA